MKFILALLLAMTTANTFGQDLSEPVHLAAKRKLPCFILVGATWCKPCQRVKRDCEAKLRERGFYMHLDTDSDRDTVDHLQHVIGQRIESIPTLVVVANITNWTVYTGDKPIIEYVESLK